MRSLSRQARPWHWHFWALCLLGAYPVASRGLKKASGALGDGCRTPLPRFSVQPAGWNFLLKPEVSGYWRRVHELLRAHPCRAEDDPGVPFAFVGTIAGSLASLAALPRRQAGYVVFAHGLQLDHCATRPDATCRAMQLVYQTRSDVSFVNLDLRDHVLARDDVVRLPGVTFAPPGFFRGKKPEPGSLGSWRWLLSYRGVRRSGWYGASTARVELDRAFRGRGDPSVAIEFLPPGRALTQVDLDRYDELLEGSAFGLVPHGDGRWSYRLSEVVGACVVPVIMANGLTLPYEEVIDWQKASVRIDEAYAGSPEMILAHLPSDPGVVRAMREEVCRVSSSYFDTMEKRVDALLASLAARGASAREGPPAGLPGVGVL